MSSTETIIIITMGMQLSFFIGFLTGKILYKAREK